MSLVVTNSGIYLSLHAPTQFVPCPLLDWAELVWEKQVGHQLSQGLLAYIRMANKLFCYPSWWVHVCGFLYPHKGRGGHIGTRILLGRVLTYSIHFHLLLLLRYIQVPTAMLWLIEELGRRPCGTELISNVCTVTEQQRMEIKGRCLG